MEYNAQFAAASLVQHQSPSAVLRWGHVCNEPPDDHGLSQSWGRCCGRMPTHVPHLQGSLVFGERGFG